MKTLLIKIKQETTLLNQKKEIINTVKKALQDYDFNFKGVCVVDADLIPELKNYAEALDLEIDDPTIDDPTIDDTTIFYYRFK